MTENSTYVTVLIETLEKQLNVLKDVLVVTKEQSEIAKSEFFEESMLEDSLNRKEVLIAQLNRLDEGFHNIYNRVRTEIKGNIDKYKNELTCMQDLIRQCTDVGNEIKVLEDRNRSQLAQCFANKHKEYGSAKTAASVASNYHKMMNNTKIMDAIFYDKKK